MNWNVNAKCIVVTGGAQGLGLAVANSFLKHGAKSVIILDINQEHGNQAITNLEENYPNKATFYKCNVVTDLEKIYHLIIEKHQKVDILINSAGIINETNIRRTIEVNTIALMEWSMKFYEYMRIDKGGSGGTIINISSIFGHKITAIFAYYHASKFAVLGFSKSIGHETNFKRTGIRVLTLCPGMTMTAFGTNQCVREQDLHEQFMSEVETNYEWQKPEDVGEATVQIFQKADSGTVWLVEGARPAIKWNI